MPYLSNLLKIKFMVSESAMGGESTFLYRLLVSPRFRWVRHALLVAALVVISFNQVLMIYWDVVARLGAWVYLLVAFNMATYALVVYFNLLCLLPKYLLHKRYFSYLLYLSLAMAVALLAQMLQEYAVGVLLSRPPARGSFFNVAMMMDYLSSFMLTILCIIGGSMTILLKLWMVDNQRVALLEKAHIHSEVEQLKEQISPGLLFRTLNRSGHLTLTDPVKASKMLMKLSQLLRYQLYDCNREKVLLSSEVTFLTNYLMLEQLYSPRFDYMLSTQGEINHTLVPPLLFIPFVQHAVQRIRERDAAAVSLCIRMEVAEDDIVFTCTCPGVDLSAGDGLKRIRNRLNLQYGHRYGLLLTQDKMRLELKGGGL